MGDDPFEGVAMQASLRRAAAQQDKNDRLREKEEHRHAEAMARLESKAPVVVPEALSEFLQGSEKLRGPEGLMTVLDRATAQVKAVMAEGANVSPETLNAMARTARALCDIGRATKDVTSAVSDRSNRLTREECLRYAAVLSRNVMDIGTRYVPGELLPRFMADVQEAVMRANAGLQGGSPP